MAADGGLYAELIKNRSFEFNSPLMGWTEHTTAAGDGTILVLNQSAENAKNPRFIRLTHFTGNPYGLSRNEQWGPQCLDRLRIFSAAIKTRYPEISLVNSVGADPSGSTFGTPNYYVQKLL